jgi:hypothetical protein
MRHLRPNARANYLIPRPDTPFIVGGACSAFARSLSLWYNIHEDSSLILPAATDFDNYMQPHFLNWEHNDAITDIVWAGIMGYISDLLPHLDSVPGKNRALYYRRIQWTWEATYFPFCETDYEHGEVWE